MTSTQTPPDGKQAGNSACEENYIAHHITVGRNEPAEATGYRSGTLLRFQNG